MTITGEEKSGSQEIPSCPYGGWSAGSGAGGQGGPPPWWGGAGGHCTDAGVQEATIDKKSCRDDQGEQKVEAGCDGKRPSFGRPWGHGGHGLGCPPWAAADGPWSGPPRSGCGRSFGCAGFERPPWAGCGKSFGGYGCPPWAGGFRGYNKSFGCPAEFSGGSACPPWGGYGKWFGSFDGCDKPFRGGFGGCGKSFEGPGGAWRGQYPPWVMGGRDYAGGPHACMGSQCPPWMTGASAFSGCTGPQFAQFNAGETSCPPWWRHSAGMKCPPSGGHKKHWVCDDMCVPPFAQSPRWNKGHSWES